MINIISSISNLPPSEAKRRRVDRFDFPIAPSSFETATFLPPQTPSTVYEKTLEANLTGNSSIFIPPQESPPPNPSWPIQKPLYTRRVAEIENDFYLTPLTIFQKALLIATKNTLSTHSSETLQVTNVFKLPSDSDHSFLSIQANPSFPLISSRTAPLEQDSALGSLLMLDLETKKVVTDLDLSVVAREDGGSRGGCISWRNGWEFITPIGYRCLQIDRRDEKPKKISFGDPSLSAADGPLFSIACYEDEQLLATSSLEGVVRIYDIRSLKNDLFSYRHGTSSVKALAWHPSLPLLASGGGLSDRFLKVIDLRDQTLLTSDYTNAQITSLIWLSKEHILAGYGRGKSPSNLEVHHFQSHSITAILHSSHPSILGRQVWTVKDPSMETGLSYYTLNGRDSENKTDRTHLSKWFLKKEDPVKRKGFEMGIR